MDERLKCMDKKTDFINRSLAFARTCRGDINQLLQKMGQRIVLVNTHLLDRRLEFERL